MVACRVLTKDVVFDTNETLERPYHSQFRTHTYTLPDALGRSIHGTVHRTAQCFEVSQCTDHYTRRSSHSAPMPTAFAVDQAYRFQNRVRHRSSFPTRAVSPLDFCCSAQAPLPPPFAVNRCLPPGRSPPLLPQTAKLKIVNLRPRTTTFTPAGRTKLFKHVTVQVQPPDLIQPSPR